MIKATFDNIIVLPLEDDEKYGNIIIPDSGNDLARKAKIVSVGPGRHSLLGNFIPTISKVGDIVVIPKIGGTRTQIDNVEYFIIQEQSILAELKNEA